MARPKRAKRTKKTAKARATRPRNRKAQDATLINLDAQKKKTKDLSHRLKKAESHIEGLYTFIRANDQALANMEQRLNARIEAVIAAGQKLENMVFPLQQKDHPTPPGLAEDKGL